MAVCVWVFGVAVFAELELYFGTYALRNLAAGVARRDEMFFRKWDTKLFNDEGQKYRIWMIRNEIAYVFWIFAIGPFAISLG